GGHHEGVGDGPPGGGPALQVFGGGHPGVGRYGGHAASLPRRRPRRPRRPPASPSAGGSSSAACPVRVRNTSSSVGRRSARSSSATPAASSSRTTSGRMPAPLLTGMIACRAAGSMTGSPAAKEDSAD